MVLPPHVDPEDLKLTLKEELAALPSAPSDDPESFFQMIVLWLISWRRQHKYKNLSSAPSLAFFQESEGARPDIWKLDPLFRESLSPDIVDSSTLFLTTATMHQVFRASSSGTTVAALHDTAVSLDCGHSPCVIYQPSQESVIWCPDGIAGSVRKRFSMLFEQIETIDQSTIDRALEDFHREYTLYPDGWVNFWYNAGEGVVEKKTENNVRNWLCHYLKFRIFKSSHIAREYQLTSGRADIWIGSVAARTKPETYILELKILRSRRFPGKGTTPKPVSAQAILRYAKNGVGQARRYKESDGAQLAYLCCFDARDKNEFLQEVSDEAVAKDILYRQYFCERSSKAA